MNKTIENDIINEKNVRIYKITLHESLFLEYYDQFKRKQRVKFHTCIFITQRENFNEVIEGILENIYFFDFILKDIPLFLEVPKRIIKKKSEEE